MTLKSLNFLLYENLAKNLIGSFEELNNEFKFKIRFGKKNYFMFEALVSLRANTKLLTNYSELLVFINTIINRA